MAQDRFDSRRFCGKDAGRIYSEFVIEGKKEESESPLIGVIALKILERPEFVREKSRGHLGEKEAARNIPAVRILTRPTMDGIINNVNLTA